MRLLKNVLNKHAHLLTRFYDTATAIKISHGCYFMVVDQLAIPIKICTMRNFAL